LIIKGYGGFCTNPDSSIDLPLPTVTTVDHNFLLQPFLIQNNTWQTRRGKGGLDIGLPLPTLTTAGHHALLEPFVVEYYGNSTTRSIYKPVSSISTNPHYALVELVMQNEGGIDNLPVVRTPEDIDNHDFKCPFCIEFNGQRYLIDIMLRMLAPRELARAMGFPESFRFEQLDGTPLTKTDAVRMIGNACPVNTVRELVKTVIQARKKEFRVK
jgi:DNA (cytosine-5)-methyltransferase 1